MSPAHVKLAQPMPPVHRQGLALLALASVTRAAYRGDTVEQPYLVSRPLWRRTEHEELNGVSWRPEIMRTSYCLVSQADKQEGCGQPARPNLLTLCRPLQVMNLHISADGRAPHSHHLP